jgi:hypothetical protein
MRTTLNLNDELLQAAREKAAREGTTLTALIEHALAAALTAPAHPRKRFKLQWRPRKGRFIGGVDLADRDALYDFMERER